MKLKIKICLLLTILLTNAYGQIGQYKYQRTLTGVTQEWHKIVLPDDIFGKVSNNFEDIRIYGIGPKNDTLEVPYTIRLQSAASTVDKADMKIINTSRNEKGHYFTLETNPEETVNRIKLTFAQQNFDWRIGIEGSHDQKEWFLISDDYRILSIKNNLTDFQFTELAFPDSRYRYYRLNVNSKQKSELQKAEIYLLKTEDGIFKNYPVQNTVVTEDKKQKETIIDAELKQPVPVNFIRINVKDKFDYHRPVTVQCLSDSVSTEKGWKYNYQNLTKSTLSSVRENEFNFRSTIARKFRIIVQNNDNKPLNIDTLQISGFIYNLTARFTEPANYFLVYGNEKAETPQYDIDQFSKKIPDSLIVLQIGEEQITDNITTTAEPLFSNKNWLWTIIFVVIVLLGWFTVRMLKQNV